MDQLNYVVLQTKKLFIPEAGSLGAPSFEAARAGSSSQSEKLEVSTGTYSKAERDDLRRSPETKAIAAVMPLKLIEPKEVSAANANAVAANATWGIDAVRATQSQFDGTGVKVAVLDTGHRPIPRCVQRCESRSQKFYNRTRR